MNLYTNDHWSLFDDVNREMRRMARSKAGYSREADEEKSWTPVVDIYEKEDEYVLAMDTPGVSPDDIQLSAEKGVLTISGSRKPELEEGGYSRCERFQGSFERRFQLPDTVDVEAIKASGSHGVLTVVIPKCEAEQVRRIPVTH
ncbi:MAG: Hsp20/alpha crystallin family protein [Gammaproteobacteria bacterium]|nr:Hsp20/alpha crystallin family protein [Gammaproteobacteria bacterium]